MVIRYTQPPVNDTGVRIQRDSLFQLLDCRPVLLRIGKDQTVQA